MVSWFRVHTVADNAEYIKQLHCKRFDQSADFESLLESHLILVYEISPEACIRKMYCVQYIRQYRCNRFDGRRVQYAECFEA